MSDPGDSSIYGLESPIHAAPPLPGTVAVRPGLDELVDALAADLVLHAENCVRQFGDFHLALSGGSDLDVLYRRLMYDPNYRRLPWRRTHLWLTADDPGGAAGQQIEETIADHADLPGEQFHRIPAGDAGASRAYEVLLQDTLAWREKGQDRLDYVLLAMDGAGTVGTPDAPTDGPMVAASGVSIGMTPALVRAVRFVAVLAAGAECAPVIHRISDGDHAFAVMAMSPHSGELHWYLDAHCARRE